VNKEDVLTWLTQLGTDWVGAVRAHYVFNPDRTAKGEHAYWDMVGVGHDSAYLTMRRTTVYQGGYTHYKLTPKAIRSLEEA
jgi:hypothetical protein